MKHLLLSAGIALSASTALAETEIHVHYAIPTIWADTQAALAEAFMEANPDITITIDGPAEGYEDGVQRLLRETIAGTAPDVAYVGLNLWRVLEDRGVLQPLDGFLPADPMAAGYTPALLSLGRFEDTQWALGTSASTLVMYVNPTLVEAAGGSMDDFPTTFDGVIELAAKIDALGDSIEGVWIARHDWRFQSLLGSHGGRPMTADESDITFDDAAGLAAATLYQRFTKEAGMSSMSENDARQAFPTGTLGIIVPLLPTVPLMILAAFCFGKSSPRLHRWLTDHPAYGPHIRDWRDRGAIRPGGKRAATLAIAAAFGLSVLLGVRPALLAVQAVVLIAVLVFIWSRPPA